MTVSDHLGVTIPGIGTRPYAPDINAGSQTFDDVLPILAKATGSSATDATALQNAYDQATDLVETYSAGSTNAITTGFKPKVCLLGHFQLDGDTITVGDYVDTIANGATVQQLDDAADSFTELGLMSSITGLIFRGGRRQVSLSDTNAFTHNALDRCQLIDPVGAGLYMGDTNASKVVTLSRSMLQLINSPETAYAVDVHSDQVIVDTCALWQNILYPFNLRSGVLQLRNNLLTPYGSGGEPANDGAWVRVVAGSKGCLDWTDNRLEGEGGGKTFCEWREACQAASPFTRLSIVGGEGYIGSGHPVVSFYGLPDLIRIKGMNGFEGTAGLHFADVGATDRQRFGLYGAIDIDNSSLAFALADATSHVASSSSVLTKLEDTSAARVVQQADAVRSWYYGYGGVNGTPSLTNVSLDAAAAHYSLQARRGAGNRVCG
jgi:hypothetical protein